MPHDGSDPGRVLIVDDEPGIRALFSRQLKLAGFDVVCAESGAEGPQAMGAVMKAAMAQTGGRADGRRVSELVQEALRR